MNKLLLTALTFLFIFSSCIPRATKDDTKTDAVVTDTISQAKPKYKSDIRKELEGYFTHQKNGGVEQVMPKHVGAEGHGIYCYFFIKGKKAISLKLHIQYTESDADLYELEANGETISYEANKEYDGAATVRVVEGASFKWYDKTLNLSDEEFLRKAENAEGVTLNLKVKETNAVLKSVKLTKEEFQSLVRTIDYYKSLDGAKIPKKGMVNIRG